MLNATFDLMGVPELASTLDKIATVVSGPITTKALIAGGNVVKAAAETAVHRLTGTLAGDVIVVTRVRAQAGERYVMIGPGWDPDAYRRVARNRGASGRDARPDQTTNPGIYGYFLEVGHRSPGKGLSNNQEYKQAAAGLRKQGRRLNTFTNPSSRAYGDLTTPAYPWLGPAFEATKDLAMEVVADTIRDELQALGGSFASDNMRFTGS